MCKDWNDNQRAIYAGLKDLGGEAAGYFKSAMAYYYDNSLPNRVSHLAHDAREIDGGLRDIFSPETLKKRAEKNLMITNITKIFGEESRDQKGHIASILVALDVDEKDDLAKEWGLVATKFAKYAHRSGIWKAGRDFEEFKPLWERYEKVLLRLVGSYYAIIARLDRLMSLNEITYASIGALLNLLQKKPYADYFFRKLDNPKWFQPLKDNGYFYPEQIKYDERGNAIFWNILEYLERVSIRTVQNTQYGKELIEIINSLVYFSIKRKNETGQGVNHLHIWWYCIKVLNNLSAAIIKDNLLIDKFKVWLSIWVDPSLGSDLAIIDLGEKLLPKCLCEDFGPDYAYAENIVLAITTIKARGKADSFTKRDDAIMQWQTYWILDAFRKYGKLIGQKCSMHIIFELAQRLSRALGYKQNDYYSDLEVGSAIYRLRVARILVDNLKPSDIQYQDDVYTVIVSQFSEDQLKGVNREEDFWAFYNLEPQVSLKTFTFTALTKDTFIAEIKRNLPEGVDWDRADKYEQKLLSLYEGLFSDYSHIWCRSLRNGPEHGEGAEDVLTVILRDVLLAKCEANRDDGSKILDAFLRESRYKFPIFKRFVLLCVDQFWTNYHEYFEKMIDSIPAILEESDLEVEMYDILRNHNADFSNSVSVKMKTLINKVPEYYVDKGDDKLIAYWKYKWLSPLCENIDFALLYEKEKQKVEPKDGKPYVVERSSFKGGFVSHKSPVAKEDMLQKTSAEIVEYLSKFKGADDRYGTFEGEPDKEGLADILEATVKEDPKKFTDCLEAFLSVDYFYLYRIIRGISDAWNAGINIDWNSFFDFSIKYLNRGKNVILGDALRAQGEDSGKGRYILILEGIVGLIGDGSRDDKRAFDSQYFDKTEQIFDLIVPLLKGGKNPDAERDALTYALNTTLGKVIRSYLSFSLRVARATQKERSNWGRDKFERFLPVGIEAYIWFGAYLPQINYLDNGYTLEKINYLAQSVAPAFDWQMFMDGYLTGAQVYKDIYRLMRANYEKALETTIFKRRVDERLVEHICVGYLQLGESLNENNENGQPSLFRKMLDEATTEDKRGRWEDVAGFFWSISGKSLKKEEKDNKEEPSVETKKKVIAFWEWTYKEQGAVKEKLGESYGAFLGRMAELTIWLDKIDDTTEKWLLLSAPYIEEQHRSAFFVEYLTKFEDEDSLKRIGKIFLKVLESTMPTFREEKIQEIVERLYKVGEKNPSVKADADNICNTYGRRGIHFLRDLFYKNQR